jgi:putative FmdB family regulatory protein
MPTYTYQCQKCGHMKDEFRKIAEREQPTKAPCEQCGTPEMRQILTANYSISKLWAGAHATEYNKYRRRKD